MIKKSWISYFPAHHEGHKAILLTAGLNVTDVHSNIRVQSETPRALHLPSRVPAEIVASSELRVLNRRQMMAVWILCAPQLALVAWFRDTDCAFVVGAASVVTAVIWGWIFNKDGKLGVFSQNMKYKSE